MEQPKDHKTAYKNFRRTGSVLFIVGLFGIVVNTVITIFGSIMTSHCASFDPSTLTDYQKVSISLTVFLMVWGITCLVMAVIGFVSGIVFKNISNNIRSKDEAAGISYAEF